MYLDGFFPVEEVTLIYVMPMAPPPQCTISVFNFPTKIYALQSRT